MLRECERIRPSAQMTEASVRLPRPASIDRRAYEAHQLPFGLWQSVRPGSGSGLGSIPSRLPGSNERVASFSNDR
jgi:hypothetical protein